MLGLLFSPFHSELDFPPLDPSSAPVILGGPHKKLEVIILLKAKDSCSKKDRTPSKDLASCVSMKLTMVKVLSLT
jgi:hypothetical protein